MISVDKFAFRHYYVYMQKIPRKLFKKILNDLQFSGKGVVIYGARQVGKTTLVNEIVGKLN